MNMELFEIWKSICKIADGIYSELMNYDFDELACEMPCNRPADMLDLIIYKINWDTYSIDYEKLKEATEELTLFNKCMGGGVFDEQIEALSKFISDNE